MSCSWVKITSALLLLLLPGIVQAQGKKKPQPGKKPPESSRPFLTSTAQAEVRVKEMNRAIQKRILLVNTNTDIKKKDKPHHIAKGLLELQSNINSNLAGKEITWPVTLAKSVVEAEHRADVIVPQWVANSTGKLLNMSGKETIKYYLINVFFEGSWIKNLKKGDTVVLTGTIKEIIVTTEGVTVALTGLKLQPADYK